MGCWLDLISTSALISLPVDRTDGSCRRLFQRRNLPPRPCRRPQQTITFEIESLSTSSPPPDPPPEHLPQEMSPDNSIYSYGHMPSRIGRSRVEIMPWIAVMRRLHSHSHSPNGAPWSCAPPHRDWAAQIERNLGPQKRPQHRKRFKYGMQSSVLPLLSAVAHLRWACGSPFLRST